jgi:hypothetical protein
MSSGFGADVEFYQSRANRDFQRFGWTVGGSSAVGTHAERGP